MLEAFLFAGRFLQFASILTLFGAALFFFYGGEENKNARMAPRWRHVVLPALALIGILIWTAAETAQLLGDNGLAFDPASLWWLLSETRIGQIHLLRIALMVLSIAGICLCSTPRLHRMTQAVVGGAATASFAWSGHGAKDFDFIHIGADTLHLVAASVWIGALGVLASRLIRSLRVQAHEDASTIFVGLNRFSGIGPATVSLLLLTGLINSWYLIGLAQWRAVFTTSYGLALSAKLVLFTLMLMLAAANRYVLTPKLAEALEAGSAPDAALRKLRGSLILEMALGLLVLAAVALLGMLEPPIALID